jgi:hypothetical protein
MSEGNAKVVRALYEAMNEVDAEGSSKLLHPEAVWVSDPRAGMGELRGRDAVMGFFRGQGYGDRDEARRAAGL